MTTDEAPSGYVPSPGVRRFRRVLTVLGLVLAVLVGVPVCLYVAHGLAGTVQTSRLREEVREEVRTARAVAQPEVLALRERQRTALPSAPTHSWAALECAFDTRDGGWIVQSYQQTCEVRTMDFLPVEGQAEADALAADLPAALFGSHRDLDRGPDCRPLRATEGRGDTSSELLWVPAATLPDGPDRCYRVMTTRSWRAQDVLEPFDAATLDQGTDWVVVVNSRTVMERRDLGCSPWSVLFCSEPFRAPVLG